MTDIFDELVDRGFSEEEIRQMAEEVIDIIDSRTSIKVDVEPFNIEDTIGPIDDIIDAFNNGIGANKQIDKVDEIGDDAHLFHSTFVYDEDAGDQIQQIKREAFVFGITFAACSEIKHRPLQIPSRDNGAVSTLIDAAVPFRLTLAYDMHGKWTGKMLYNDDGSPHMHDVQDEDGNVTHQEHSKEYKSGTRVVYDVLAELANV